MPPLAVLLVITLAPAGRVICSACTVATTVDPAAELLEANIPPQTTRTTSTTTCLATITATPVGCIHCFDCATIPLPPPQRKV